MKYPKDNEYGLFDNTPWGDDTPERFGRKIRRESELRRRQALRNQRLIHHDRNGNRIWTYILDDQGNPIPEPDAKKVVQWSHDNRDKIIIKESRPSKDIVVRTSFFCYVEEEKCKTPSVFRTVIFFLKSAGKHTETYIEDYYPTRLQASLGHQRIVHQLNKLACEITLSKFE